MSGKLYAGVGGVARKVKHLYVGVDSTARKVKRMYAGVSGVAELVFSSEITITLNGAPGETISYTGEASGNVTLNSSGIYAGLVLNSGNYTFTGSISGYSKNIDLDDDGTVNVYPDRALFWYGNGDTSGDSLYDKCGGFAGSSYESSFFGPDYYAASPSVSVGTNSVMFTLSAGTNKHDGSAWMNTAFTVPEGATIKAVVGGGANGIYRYADLAASKVDPYTPSPTTPSIGTITSSVQTLSADLSSYSGDTRLFVVTLGYNSTAGYTSIAATLYALWLE